MNWEVSNAGNDQGFFLGTGDGVTEQRREGSEKET